LFCRKNINPDDFFPEFRTLSKTKIINRT